MFITDVIARFALIVLSVASFIPQVQCIRRQGDLTGISLSYILFNLIIDTHLFAMSLHWFLIDVPGPPNICDWLDTIQFTVVWVGQLMLFHLAFVLPTYDPARKNNALATFLSFVAITLASTILEAFLPKDGEGEGSGWYSAILSGIFMFYMEPLMQLLGLVALYAQAQEIRSRGSSGSLSVNVLFIQALVFLLVGISFYFRLQLPAEVWEPDPDPDSPRNSPEWNTPLAKFVMSLSTWYWYVGWATVSNLIFAFAQGVLGLLAWRFKAVGELEEHEALLGH